MPRIPELLIHASFGLLTVLLLVGAGAPLTTDDTWWHLVLGDLYAASGPWLESDPRLHTALGPPQPNAWLFDLGMKHLVDLGGLAALRIAHVLIVAAIVGTLWSTLRRRELAPATVSLACSIFITVSSYRLLQARPELATILATLLLYRVVLDGNEQVPSWWRVSVASLLCALWSNLHPGFLLGPLLLVIAAAGVAARAIATRRGRDPLDCPRAVRLTIASVFALAATGLNPDGFAALAKYVTAGVSSATSAIIVDEWTQFNPFAIPHASLPPTPLVWTCMWGLLLTASPIVMLALRRWTMGKRSDLDPALVSLAAAGLVAPFIAVRFLWLGLFPIMLLCDVAPRRIFLGWKGRAIGLAAVVLVPAYTMASDWTVMSKSLRRDTYLLDYDADRYYAHGVNFLRETGVQGNLFNPYFMGGFLEYWLSPQLRTFVDGSLNVSSRVITDYETIQLMEGGSAGDFDELLEEYNVDFFFGVGLPTAPPAGRPWRYTTNHPARGRQWLMVYRGLRGAIYMRRHERNIENLDRIACYYASVGVPFDRERGMDVAKVLSDSTKWAIEYGIAPVDYPHLMAAMEKAPARLRQVARDRLAATYAALGLYERALEIDSGGLRGVGRYKGRDRRRLYSLIQLDDATNALGLADALAAREPKDALTQSVIELARRYAEADSEQERRRIAAMGSLLSRVETGRIKAIEKSPLLIRGANDDFTRCENSGA